MSTRGAFGFTKNGVNKITYNHFDSYPTGLGLDIIEFIMNNNIEKMNKIFNSITMVKYDDVPTVDQLKILEEYFGSKIDIRKIKDMEDLIGSNQYITDFQKGFPFMLDNEKFMGDSLFCEYAYIINLDDNTLEVYYGGNCVSQNNKFSKFARQDEDYKEVALVGKIKLNELRTMKFGMYKETKEED